MKVPEITMERRIARLSPPKGNIRMVLDTDTYNEIDDQFALVYALKSIERLQVEALYAAPFHNQLSQGPQDGMEKSYEEILRILDRLGMSQEGFVFKGSTGYLPGPEQPVHSEAAYDLVKRAMESPDDEPLYVAAIGAITNIASAILIEPKIIEKIVVVWLGGHALHWPDTKEFNLRQDLHASRLILDCGVPLVLIPCMGVASHLQTTLSEINDYASGRGAIGDYLTDIFKRCYHDHFGYSRVLWDLSAIAYLLNEAWTPSQLIHSPILTDQFTWSIDHSRHLIRYVHYVHRNAIFKDLFSRLAQS